MTEYRTVGGTPLITPLIPMYLVHAYPLHSGLFADLDLPEGIAARFPDLRGFGSRPLANSVGRVPAPDLGVCAEDLAGELDERGDQAAIIGGVSIGGYVALEFAAKFPERVLGLILANTRSTTDRPGEQGTRLDVAAKADRGEIPAASDLVRPLMADMAPAQARQSLEAMASQARPESLAWAQRAMVSRRDTSGALASLTVPTLVIAGELDTVTPLSDSDALASTASRSTLVEIAGAGHLTPAEAPAAFAGAIRDWFGRHQTDFHQALAGN